MAEYWTLAFEAHVNDRGTLLLWLLFLGVMLAFRLMGAGGTGGRVTRARASAEALSPGQRG